MKLTSPQLQFFFLLCALFFSREIIAQRQVALIIGNADYAEAPLKNPLNDARDIAKTLRELNFEVIEVTNATKKGMLEAINDFSILSQNAEVGLFYYAGHGLQYHGKNYLIPLKTSITVPADLEQETVDVGRILGRMEQNRIPLSIVILDACRNNPFHNLMGFRSFEERGLTVINTLLRGSLIAFATQPDNVAEDGKGRNGTYTKHLLNFLKKPGLSLHDFFNEVGFAVSEETDNRQIPWFNTSPLPKFCFSGCKMTSDMVDSVPIKSSLTLQPPSIISSSDNPSISLGKADPFTQSEKIQLSNDSNPALSVTDGEQTVSAGSDARVENAPRPLAQSTSLVMHTSVAGWIWPTSGQLLSSFSANSRGLKISGQMGQAIVATAAGEVVYSGNELRGYGNIVIIKHNDTLLSAYAHNSKLLVKEGEVVTQGQKIAEMGSTDTDSPQLHFEIRRRGKPIDPMEFLSMNPG